MKKIIIALTLLASSAFAVTTTYEYPKYDGVDVNNLCDAGVEFHTINPVSVCDSWTEIVHYSEGGPSDWICNAAHMEHAVVSKTGSDCLRYDHSEQNGGTCLEMGTVTRSNTVLAAKVVSNGESADTTYFHYTIPACMK